MSSDDATPRLRMFAGPNGSGKSTIKSLIGSDLLGVFINPDEIESGIKQKGSLDFQQFGIDPPAIDVLSYFRTSAFLQAQNLGPDAEKLTFRDSSLSFENIAINSYFASVAADLIRHNLLLARRSFSFETVMSSPDKLDFLKKSRQDNYRNYLYYVATDDPLINISRVAQRVKEGGHDVPGDKVESRYYRSLDLLLSAIKLTDRAYLFDNSNEEAVWLAENNGRPKHRDLRRQHSRLV